MGSCQSATVENSIVLSSNRVHRKEEGKEVAKCEPSPSNGSTSGSDATVRTICIMDQKIFLPGNATVNKALASTSRVYYTLRQNGIEYRVPQLDSVESGTILERRRGKAIQEKAF